MKSVKLLIYMLFLVPSLAFGMNNLSDEELGTVTAQAGISLTQDDVILYQSFGKISFVDRDGGSTAKNPFYYLNQDQLLDNAQGASLNLENLEIDVLRVNAIGYQAATSTRSASIINSGKQTAVYNITRHSFTANPLIIDIVDELPALSTGYNYMLSAKNNDFGKQYLFGLPIPIPLPTGEKYNRIGIYLGLPTIDIYINELNIEKITVTAEDQINRKTVNNDSSIVQIGIQGLDLAILSGFLEFSANKETGLDSALDDVQMYLKINELKFTDTDGINLTSAVGKDNTVGYPASLVLKDIEADLIHINALNTTDLELKLSKLLGIAGSTIYGLTPEAYRDYVAKLIGDYKVNILSSGHDPAHLEDLNNYSMLNLIDVLKSWHPYPLHFDTTRLVPLTALMYASNMADTLGLDYFSRAPFSEGGVFITPGTLELYIDSLSIGQVAIRDESSASTKAVNDGASFFKITMTKAQIDTLNGNVEISSH
jgi:hypothetical protein